MKARSDWRKGSLWRAALWLVLFSVLSLRDRTAAAETSPAALAPCIEGAITLPLLGGRGDSPIIPATVNGHDVAFYLTPIFSHSFIRAAPGLWFPKHAEVRLVGQDGAPTTMHWTSVDRIVLDHTTLEDVPMLELEREATSHVGNRPVIGVIGRDLLEHLNLLLDMPHRQVALVKWKKPLSGLCATAPERLLGDNVVTTPLLGGGDSIRLVDGSVGITLALDPDLSENVLLQEDATSLGVSAAELRNDVRMTTKYVGVVAGYRHVFPGFTIGNYRTGPLPAVVQERVDTAALGHPFFEKIVALFDFPTHRFLFVPTEDRDDTPSLHLHFDRSFVPVTHVGERRGTLPRTQVRETEGRPGSN